jgi:signal peptidase I
MEGIVYQNKDMVFRYRGKSMYPTFKEGMLIVAEEALPLGIRCGEIIVYEDGSLPVVHRVIKIIKKEEGVIFVTKGDNQAYTDASFIREGNFIGRVKTAFLENNPGRDLLIKNRAIVFLYVIIGNIILWVRKNRQAVPVSVRNVLKPIVGECFLAAKKITHFISSLCKR